MEFPVNDRFKELFQEDNYITMKNYLYNYLLRKRAIEKNIQCGKEDLVLEVGSGISPVMTRTERIVYSDLSLTALKILKQRYGKGEYVVADAMNLPFKDDTFSHSISSEVLEHLKDDQKAVNELARVLKPSGHLVITFPHRKFYFTNDDRFMSHFRRYELTDMERLLKNSGFSIIYVQKVLGLLEKITMSFIIFCFSIFQKIKPKKTKKTKSSNLMRILAPLFKWGNLFYMWVVWLEAKIIPQSVASVLLIDSVIKKKNTNSKVSAPIE